MTSNMAIALGIAVMAGIAVFAFISMFFRTSKSAIAERKIEEKIDELRISEVESYLTIEEKEVIKSPWFRYWYQMFAGIGSTPADPRFPGLVVAFGIIAIAAIGVFVWPGNVIVGLPMGISVIFIIRSVVNSIKERRLSKIESQLPLLIAGMRANLSANMTPRDALLSQAREIPAPLGEELEALRQELNLNAPLDVALEHMGRRLPSGETRFLIASLRIAISEGADLDKLLATLHEVIDERAKLKHKLSSAIAGAQPAIFVTSLAIPLGFLFTFNHDQQTQDFWMSLVGLLLIGVVGVLYTLSLFVTRRMINKVKVA